MALTGIQIQKLLPKTNCKECGSNTCLAFAMKLAAKKAALSECPYASDEAKQVLGAASEPPVKGIALGKDKALKLGEETVLYRHEKTFVNRTALGVLVREGEAAAITAIAGYCIDKVGEKMGVDLIAVQQTGSDAAAFAAFAKQAAASRPLVVLGRDTAGTVAAAAAIAGTRSLLVSRGADDVAELVAAAKAHGHAVAITAPDLDQLAALSTQVKAGGFNDLVLNFQTHSLAERFQTNSLARAAALKSECKAMGYPTLAVLPDEPLADLMATATVEISKYGGLCVLPAFDPALFDALLTLRQNLYTDPQKPIQVEPKLYAIGEPTKASPVFITTNFSLTYFIVSSEIENAGVSAWLVVPECEGMSVLTAWAAGKFSGASIGKFCKGINLDSLVDTRQIVIPGYVAQISGELEENLPGWKVMVGPQEAGDLESFVKMRMSA